jgi:30S ribosomal protein S31
VQLLRLKQEKLPGLRLVKNCSQNYDLLKNTLKSRSSGTFFIAIVGKFSAILQLFKTHKKTTMGRGDKKTKKGKIFKGSFGKSRSARTKKVEVKKAETK